MSFNNELSQELGTNFIEYAVAVNTDRSIPNANDGFKPVAKRIIYGTYDSGYKSDKPHVKCANIVGQVMANWHPHGDSSIYGALVRLSQPWTMRYPLIDFHGSNGNIDGDGPAAYRYTEARLTKLVEDGMLFGIKKDNVDFIDNYSETDKEPIELPAIFPNLLCNPNSGIGVAIACNWAPHNLKEVAQAIYDYIDGKEPMLPGPDFPTGGIVINKDDIPNIMKTGHGSVKLRGKHHIEKNNIVFTEIPYGVTTEALMTQIGEACDNGEIIGVENIRNESNKKGFRLVIECEKNASIMTILNKLFAKTNLQTSFSYNQVALVDKTPTELNLKDCVKIYVDFNTKTIVREVSFDIKKINERLHIIAGLIKALDIIDDIIAMIKKSESAAAAKKTLIDWGFSEEQAKAILDMKLSKLAKLEKEELKAEEKELKAQLMVLQEIAENPIPELRKRLEALVKKYGDDRRTELIQISSSKEEKEIEFVEPEKCVVVLTESGNIKRIPTASYRTQKRNGKGIKTQDDITSMILRTNTIDSLMVFTDKGKMYRLLVNDIPVGTNASQGQSVKSLVNMEADESPAIIYSIYRDTDAKYVFFTTKNGIVKKTALDEYINTKKKSGVAAINLREDDSLASVCLVKDEDMILLTKNGMGIRFSSLDVGTTSRATVGVKGMAFKDDDEIISALPIRHKEDSLAIFSTVGTGKKFACTDLPVQKRGGKGLICHKVSSTSGNIASAALVSDGDNILLCGDKTSICVAATDIPTLGRASIGNQMLKGNKALLSVSKV
jgi:DNA gyrase subunit A